VYVIHIIMKLRFESQIPFVTTWERNKVECIHLDFKCERWTWNEYHKVLIIYILMK